jgi:purine-cytosine permease-like protein
MAHDDEIGEETTDDDALADALAADLSRIASGPITIVTPNTAVPPGPAAAEVVPPPARPAQPGYTPSAYSAPAWSGFPAPDPSEAVPLPDGPPVRKSMPDNELNQWVARVGDQPGGTLAIIEQLQSQMKLREEESREFRAWEDRMRSLGTPDALGAVDAARPRFSGVLPDAPAGPATGSFVLPENPVADWPAPDFEDTAPTAPSSRETQDELPRPWDVPAPSATWAPAPEWDTEQALAQAPAPEPATRAPFDWSPEPEPVQAEPVEARPVPEPEPVQPEPVPEPDATPAPVPPALASPPPTSPPPLIEPGTFGGMPRSPAQAKIPAPFSFDALLDEGSGDGSAEGDAVETDPAPDALFIEPMPVAAGEPVPTETGSITIVDPAYDEDLDDDVDETDRAFDVLLGPVAVDAAGTAALGSVSPPSGPISTVRLREDEQVLFDDEPIHQRVFSIEDVGIESTPVDHRVGRAARLFWLWFAANSSILSLGLGAAVFAVGMSLRQSIVAILAGVAISFLPLGLTTLAGKRSGQPTMVVSRASFGLIGNTLPAVIALVTRLFWGAVLLWLLASSVAIVIVGAGLDGALGERGVLLVSLAGAFLVAVLVAFAGYPMIARIQLVLSLVSGILVVGLIVMTYSYIDIPQALTAPDGPWVLTITGAVLVFSFVGLVWANSGADLARYQRPETNGATSMLWATFGTTLPSFVLIGYGALLAASDEGIASGFLLSPLDTLALMLPSWYPIPLVAATALSLLSGIVLSLYSGGFALQAIGVRLKRQWSILVLGVLLGGLALLLGFGVAGGINELFRDAATTLAVPTAAWAGIFAAETMIRNRRFESQSLVRRGGVYSDVRWVNVIGLILFTAIGYGLTTATVSWLAWQGFGFSILGVPLDGDLAGTDLGVLVALFLGLLLPIVAGIPAIRKQEAARAPE